MFDGKKIITGLAIGIILLLFPFFYNAGKAAKPPDPQLSPEAKAAKTCVESKSFMTTNHMKLLDQWRTEAVRNDERFYTSAAGKMYDMNLQNTCLECHTNKAQFCDQCHNYMDVTPYCWNCHFEPKENQ